MNCNKCYPNFENNSAQNNRIVYKVLTKLFEFFMFQLDINVNYRHLSHVFLTAELLTLHCFTKLQIIAV